MRQEEPDDAPTTEPPSVQGLLAAEGASVVPGACSGGALVRSRFPGLILVWRKPLELTWMVELRA